MQFAVRLPAVETQFVLRPGESVDGPALLVTAVAGRTGEEGRAEWLRQRG